MGRDESRRGRRSRHQRIRGSGRAAHTRFRAAVRHSRVRTRRWRAGGCRLPVVDGRRGAGGTPDRRCVGFRGPAGAAVGGWARSGLAGRRHRGSRARRRRSPRWRSRSRGDDGFRRGRRRRRRRRCPALGLQGGCCRAQVARDRRWRRRRRARSLGRVRRLRLCGVRWHGARGRSGQVGRCRGAARAADDRGRVDGVGSDLAGDVTGACPACSRAGAVQGRRQPAPHRRRVALCVQGPRSPTRGRRCGIALRAEEHLAQAFELVVLGRHRRRGGFRHHRNDRGRMLLEVVADGLDLRPGPIVDGGAHGHVVGDETTFAIELLAAAVRQAEPAAEVPDRRGQPPWSRQDGPGTRSTDQRRRSPDQPGGEGRLAGGGVRRRGCWRGSHDARSPVPRRPCRSNRRRGSGRST